MFQSRFQQEIDADGYITAGREKVRSSTVLITEGTATLTMTREQVTLQEKFSGSFHEMWAYEITLTTQDSTEFFAYHPKYPPHIQQDTPLGGLDKAPHWIEFTEASLTCTIKIMQSIRETIPLESQFHLAKAGELIPIMPMPEKYRRETLGPRAYVTLDDGIKLTPFKVYRERQI